LTFSGALATIFSRLPQASFLFIPQRFLPVNSFFDFEFEISRNLAKSRKCSKILKTIFIFRGDDDG
jgi:hypothetical protein